MEKLKHLIYLIPLLFLFILTPQIEIQANTPLITYHDNTESSMIFNQYRMTVLIKTNGAQQITINNPTHIPGITGWTGYPENTYTTSTIILDQTTTNRTTATINVSNYEYITLTYPKSNLPASWYPSPGFTDFATVQQTTISVFTPAPAEPTAPTIDFTAQPLIASYTLSTDLNPDPDFFRFKLDVTFTQPLAAVIRTKSVSADFSDAPDYPNIKLSHTFFLESRLSATGHDFLELFIDNIHFGEVPQTGWQGNYSWNPQAGQDPEAEPTVTYTFKNESGQTIEELIIEIYKVPNSGNTAQFIPAVPPKEGHTIVGWSVDLDQPATENKTITPVYEALPTYTVTFLDWDNTLIGTVTVTQGQTATPPFIPTRTGYTFTSWLPPVANIQGNITTTAQYTANTYLVTWTSDNVEIKANQVAHDTVILNNAPFVTKENHTLVGWKIDPTETLVTSGQLVTGPLSLTAVWQEVPTFTVTWRDPSFNTLKIEYVIESGLATAPSYNPGSGLVLVGWTPDPTQPITQNTTFIAVVQTAPTPPLQPGTINATGLTDLFTGVFGAIVGSLMILGTIDLFGLQLSSLLWLFFAGTGFMLVWKLLKG